MSLEIYIETDNIQHNHDTVSSNGAISNYKLFRREILNIKL